ncbi:hypothetical protein Cgig2_017722 [Carnegiea gigantea]|uniref:Uncharacterized protein n=1 Tax=Carnegiea gigantea TaxID=171969 RepID=A0A9Q1GRY4_9CARY|nr:hypothetical protein Cgig2_017722 [Carnegiea gigantea]
MKRKKKNKNKQKPFYARWPGPHHRWPHAPEPRHHLHQESRPHRPRARYPRYRPDCLHRMWAVRSLAAQDFCPRHELGGGLRWAKVSKNSRKKSVWSSTMAVALLLSLGHLFIPSNASQASFSFFSFSQRRLYLAADSSNLCRSVWRLPICPYSTALELWRLRICFFRIEADDGKEEKSRNRRDLTSAMATCSSVTLGGSAELEGAKSYDLARRSTI